MRGELFDRVHTHALALDERKTGLLESCLSDDVVWSLRPMGERRIEPTSGRAAAGDALNLMVTEARKDHAIMHACVLQTSSVEAVTRLRSGIYRFRLRRDYGVWLVTGIDAGYEADVMQAPEGSAERSGGTELTPGLNADLGPAAT